MPLLKEKPRWRNVLFACLIWIFRKLFPANQGFEKAVSSNITLQTQGKALFIRIDQRLGNVLLTIPTIKNFKALFPDFSIDVLVASKFQSALQQLSYIQEIIPFDKKLAFRNPCSFFLKIFSLRKREYDIVFDCSHSHIYSATGCMLSLIIGKKYRVGHFHEISQNIYTHSVAVSLSAYEIDQKNSLLSIIKDHQIIPFGRKMETSLGLKSESQNYVKEYYHQHGITHYHKKVIGLNTGARKQSNRVNENFYAGIIKEIIQNSTAHCIIFWGPDEKHITQRYEEIFSTINDRIFIAPSTDIEQLACFIDTLAVFITNDTGPMHLSVAKGCATFGIFLNTESQRWGHHHHPHRCFELQNLSEVDEKKLIKHIAQAAIKLYKLNQ